MRPGKRTTLIPYKFLKLVLLANHRPHLHGVRVLAILMVVQLHVTVEFQSAGLAIPELVSLFSRSFWFGMDCFFILSGYLIGSMLFSGKSLDSFTGFLRFYVRRGLRIFPLYFGVLFLLIIIFGVSVTQRETILHELLFLTNYPFRYTYIMPYSWSLSVEEHFYLIVPFVLAFVKRIKWAQVRIGVFLGLWLSGTLIRLFIASLLEPPFQRGYENLLYTPTHCRIDILIGGVFLAYLEKYHPDFLPNFFNRKYVRGLFFLIALISFLFLFKPHATHISSIYWEALLPGTFSSLFYFPILVWVLYSKSHLKDFLSHPAFRVIATLGYGVYLVHLPVAHFFSEIISDVASYRVAVLLLGNVFVLVLSLAISYILHIIIEKPFMLLRDRLFASR